MDNSPVRVIADTVQPKDEDPGRQPMLMPEAPSLQAEEIAKVLGDPRDHAQMKTLTGLRVSCWTAPQ
jgi:hypothetical protein